MDKGIVGLKNRGNTCYLNTSIQCLSNIEELSNYFINDEYVDDLNNRFSELKGKKIDVVIVSKEYSKLIKAIWNSNKYIEPRSFHEAIQRYDSRFIGYDQQDAQEVLAFILDNLHEGLKYDVEINYIGNIENKVDELVVESIKHWKKDVHNKYSIVAELFFGQFINKVVSLENNKIVSKRFELYNMLNVPISGRTLYDSLSKYFEKETLESKYLDEKSGKEIDAYRQIKLMRIPKYLIIVLKRYNNYSDNLYKVNQMISFPFSNLDMTPYTEGYDMVDCKMELVSIGCHIGGINGGHYFAVCRHKNKNWYKYDDETASEFSMENDKNYLFKYAYILIYKKNN